MSIFKKEKTYGKQTDINALTQSVYNHLRQEGWKAQQKAEGNRGIIQAQKGGILRDIIAAEHALIITFEQVPEGTKLTMGAGKWVQNLGVMAVETLLLSPLFIPLDVSEMLWTDHVEKGLMHEIDSIVDSV
ncbi:MAG: hypothetical protein KIS30_05655 [Thermoplasmata archaeon]|nr:hypothetical protein [Candidatus Sysuiplasma acidicola]MBX8637119.1 hypothetical protein [Candidatus Sysuiplasma acidicola]MBX8646226.1 hypothetical protein [Candidatus Sysuiplasma acidicola]